VNDDNLSADVPVIAEILRHRMVIGARDNHEFLYARRAQAIHQAGHDRFSCDWQHGFGSILGEGTQAHAAPGGEYHSLVYHG